MKTSIQLINFLVILIVSLLVVSCGGGSDGGLPTESPLPQAETPTNIQTNLVNGNAIITWNTISGNSYNLHVSTDNGASYGLVKQNLTESKYIDKNILTNISFVYALTTQSDSTSESLKSNKSNPIKIDSSPVKLSASTHTCQIKEDSSLWCWGKNESGQLGIGTKTSIELKTQVGTALDWNQVEVGYNHTCAIKKTGDLYCWGDIPNNSVSAGATPNLAIPNIIIGTQNWISISLGYNITCGIKSDTKMYCWEGKSTVSTGLIAVDTPTIFNSRTPNIVIDINTKDEMINWSSLSVGQKHICAIQSINNESKTYCWGNRLSGQLADNSESDTDTTKLLNPNIENSQSINWYKIHAGNNYTCAIKRDNSLWCWGGNEFGKLGNNDVTKQKQHLVSEITDTGTNIRNWINIKTGNNHTCGIRAIAETNNVIANRIFCWGQNTYGQLGKNDLLNSLIPTQSGNLIDTDWKDLSVGNLNTCATKINNTLYCWGSRNDASFGDIKNNSSGPKQVGIDNTWSILISGNNFTIAGSSLGYFGWGENNYSQLNNGSLTNKKIPTAFSLSRSYNNISAGAITYVEVLQQILVALVI